MSISVSSEQEKSPGQRHSIIAVETSRLAGSVKSALFATLCLGALWSNHASATPDPPLTELEEYIVEGWDPSYWDWTGWNDSNISNDWEGVLLADHPSNGNQNSPVCNAIRTDMPQDCDSSDVYRAHISMDVSEIDVSRYSGLGFAIAASNMTWFNAARSHINQGIGNYIDAVSLVQANTSVDLHNLQMRNAGQQLIADIANGCNEMGTWYFYDWEAYYQCTIAVNAVANEMGWSNFIADLLQFYGITSVSVYGFEASLDGRNSIEDLIAGVKHRNECATAVEALDRNGCL